MAGKRSVTTSVQFRASGSNDPWHDGQEFGSAKEARAWITSSDRDPSKEYRTIRTSPVYRIQTKAVAVRD